MEWEGRRQSDNASYKRGTGKKIAAGGGIGTIIIAIIMFFVSGGDLSSVFGFLQNSGGLGGGTTQTEMVDVSYDQMDDSEKKLFEYTAVILAETEDVWTAEFQRLGKTYRKPRLQAFTGGSIKSACGYATSATGPFYCAADECVYIDLSFFNEMNTKFAKGDFPMAYVIAHEVGHHVQHLLGTLDQVQSLYNRVSETEYNKYNVRLELQADFYAGFWANKSKRTLNLTNEDINDALQAANAIGDDRLQKEAQGYVVPDSFTHGTSEQRSRWFKRGYDSGDVMQGDTFNATSI